MNEIEKLKREIEDLKNWKKSLEASHSIPLNIDQAFRARLISDSDLSTSTKDVDSEDVTVLSSVNFIAQTTVTTTVLDDPDIFLEVEINGTKYYIPAYTT